MAKSGMRQTFTVYFSDGNSETRTSRPIDYVMYEKAHKRPWGEDQSVSAVMWLMWHVWGKPGANLDSWVGTIEDFEDVDSGDSSDPTSQHPEHSDG